MASKQLDSLEPAFREKIVQLLQIAKNVTELEWVVTSGRRTMKEQQALYDQGRKNSKPVVTKAPPGSSAHNFGLAADLAPIKDGDIWWEAPRKLWKGVADAAQELGLTAGFYFKTILDMPHVEDPSWKERQAEWKAGKITLL